MYDATNCIVIGAHETIYQFWTRDGQRKITEHWFGSDRDAIEWFSQNYPNEYRVGVEMRVLD